MTRVFIGRLSINARENDVEKFLRGYGKLRDISLKRGYGFVVSFERSSRTRLAERKYISADSCAKAFPFRKHMIAF